MANKKITLASVAGQMQKGFQKIDARMERGFAAVAGDVADIKRDMATKEHISALATQVGSIERELRDIKRRLTHFEDNVTGYRQEIDHALERIAAIEKHLGINKKIAA